MSPRPDTLTIITLSLSSFGARLITSASACELSIAGIIPSVLVNRSKASTASSSVALTYSARFASFRNECSGPIPG